MLLLTAWVAVGCTPASNTASAKGGGGTSATPTPSATAVTPNAVVVAHVDGDTLKVNIDGVTETVRLIGIDTPETKKPGTPVECFGKEASAHLAALVPQGMPVRLERDVEERDRYGRLLVYLYRATDGLFVNLAMVTDGFAAQLTIPPNVAHVDEFRQAAAEAREAGRGLWGSCGGAHSPT
ncbi:MAG: thermonuclease family protein [Acidimicrobiales bacterium]|nr:thermonuclease family protein [Acidimicrobiales bacterium]